MYTCNVLTVSEEAYREYEGWISMYTCNVLTVSEEAYRV